MRLGWHPPSTSRQGVEDRRQLGFQPGVQHDIGAAGHAFDAHLASRWMEERQQLGRAMTNVFMRISSRLNDGVPMYAGLRNGLIWTSFVHAPHGQTHAFTLGIGLLDQAFFALASGSWSAPRRSLIHAEGAIPSPPRSSQPA